MKRCFQCGQHYPDDYLVCLQDGTPLVADTSNVSGQPAGAGVNPVFVYVTMGLLALVAAVAIIMWARASADKAPHNPTNTAAAQQLEEEKKRQEQARMETQKQRLQEEEAKIEREKQEVAREKAKLERQQNNPSASAPPQNNDAISRSGVAIVFRPPSNVREAPKGRILCSVHKKATINIYGIYDGPEAYDEDGVWVYTDVCGSRGVIHSTQIRF